MSSGDNISEEKGRFEDIWQGILPGLEPLPREAISLEALPKTDITSLGASLLRERRVPENSGACERRLMQEKRDQKSSGTWDERRFLQERLELESSICMVYRALLKRCPSTLAAQMRTLAAEQRRMHDTIRTLYFVLTGEEPPEAEVCPYISRYAHSMRNLCNEQHQSSQIYADAEGLTEDARLKSAFVRLSREKREQSIALMALLNKII